MGMAASDLFYQNYSGWQNQANLKTASFAFQIIFYPTNNKYFINI